MRTYLDPTAPIAPDALLVDDPKIAMDLAVATCESPRMSNLAHGLWGYHGAPRDGAELTIQSLGIGGPSTAVVMADLAALGVQRAIRIGFCIAQDDGLERGSSLVATQFVAGDGAGTSLSGGKALEPDSTLTDALIHATGAASTGAVQSVDVLGAAAESGGGVVAVDLSSAAFAAVAVRDGISCACGLVVAGHRDGSALDREALDEALIGLGVRAAAALSAVPQASGS
jgi:purine-nucleoside phosphorylase